MMLNLKQPYRQDVNAAWRQLELEEKVRNENSQREARRMVYRPRSLKRRILKRIAIFLVCFLLVGLFIIGVMAL